jgi:hypothetical protein
LGSVDELAGLRVDHAEHTAGVDVDVELREVPCRRHVLRHRPGAEGEPTDDLERGGVDHLDGARLAVWHVDVRRIVLHDG